MSFALYARAGGAGPSNERTAGMSSSRIALLSIHQHLGRRRGQGAAIEPLEGRRLLSAAIASTLYANDLGIGAGAPVASVGTTPTRSPSVSGSGGLKIV